VKTTRLLIVLLLAAAVWTGSTLAGETAKTKGTTLFVCNCGPDCKCGTVKTEPGKCGCGHALAGMHVLKIDQGEALLCTCGESCECKLSEADPSKCGCGKPVKKVSLKGLYACACGPACTCTAISGQPGKCGCGKDLVQVP